MPIKFGQKKELMIIERNYDMKIEGMVLVQIHPQIKQCQCHRVMRLEDQINRILEMREEELDTSH